MKRKIAAIMAADVAGYSRLVAEDEDDTLQRLIAYREVFADFVGRGGGRIFNTAGDAVLAEFSSAVEGLRAAIDIQESIRTRNLSVPDRRHMRFRIGMTIGDVVERDGDLLGDGVNIAARLESLAEPGGICISRGLHEQVGNRLSVAFRDIGLQSVKNIPMPIHAYTVSPQVLDLSPEAPPTIRSRRPWVVPVVAVLTVLLGVGAGLVVYASWSRRASPQPAVAARLDAPVSAANAVPTTAPVGTAEQGRPLIFGPVARAPDDTAPPKTFDALAIPFVCDACRKRIGAVASKGRNSAVAISVEGSSGVTATRDTPDQASEDALSLCKSYNAGTCELYAVNDDVVWPHPFPPMPQPPFVDADGARTPFDVSLLGGLSEAARAHVREGYGAGQPWKALALGRDGYWTYYVNGASQDEVVRRALERCGDRAGSACRIVALGENFVVAPTQGPVDPVGDAFDRCTHLAAAPFDGVGATHGVSFADIEAAAAVPACRAALAARPDDPHLLLSLGRALDKQGGAAEEAVALMRKASDDGDPAAMNALGMAYDEGRVGLPRDETIAAALYRKAANAGNPDGTRNLGFMYMRGTGVQTDRGRASVLFDQANRAAARLSQKSE